MAKPQEKPRDRAATVSACAATDCSHNEDRDCTADEIELRVESGRAVCATYTTERPKARP